MNSAISSSRSRALIFEKCGDPGEVLELRDGLPSPSLSPAHGEVRVRMIAAPINPSDLLFIQDTYGVSPELPSGAGFEGVGVVQESGGGLWGRFLVGKRVAVIHRRGGTWSTECIVEAKNLIPLPRRLSDEQGATFLINPATACMLTRQVLRAGRGDWVMQSAAGSSVGRMVIALGRRFGFRTLNVVRREEQREELTRLGADAVMRATPETPLDLFRNSVRETCGGSLPTRALDPVAGEVGSLLLQSLGDRGKLVIYGSLSGAPVPADPHGMILHETRVEGFWLNLAMRKLTPLQRLSLVWTLKSLHSEGVFDVSEVRSYPLEEFRSALQESRTAHGGVKVLLRMEEESSRGTAR